MTLSKRILRALSTQDGGALANDIPFDWARCLTRANDIWNEDRWFRNSSFLKTAAYCERAMREIGLMCVERLDLRADGKTPYGEWVIPRAWEARGACLRLGGAEGQILADYAKVPCSLSMYSAKTPPEGITAQLIDVTNGVIDESARGKLLFTHQPAHLLEDAAAKYGALGIVTSYFPYYSGIRESSADMTGVSRWDNNFAQPRNTAGLFAFNLTPENGELLKRTLADGQDVRLYARVDTEAFDGVLPTISGAIPGLDASAGEILMYAHLYEQGANDNASGCAILLEVADMINRAIRSSVLPAPRRTLRIALGQECAGSTGYMLAHPERDARLCVVSDMVGCETRDRARLGIWHNPLSNYSFLDGMIEALTALFARDENFEWDSRAFSIGTDNMLGDPSFNMPTVALVSEPALSYHSSLDTPDRLEENVMRRNASILFCTAVVLLYADEHDINDIFAISNQYIQKKERESLNADQRALWNLIKIQIAAELSAYCAGKRATKPSIRAPYASPPDADATRVPIRTVKGCLYYPRRDAITKQIWRPAWNTDLHLQLFWADGKRNLWDIARLYSAEIASDDTEGIYLSFKALCETLAAHNRNCAINLKP